MEVSEIETSLSHAQYAIGRTVRHFLPAGSQSSRNPTRVFVVFLLTDIGTCGENSHGRYHPSD